MSNLPAGPGFPASILSASRIAQALYARRGMRDGLTIPELASRLRMSEGTVVRRLTAISEALCAAQPDGWCLWEDAGAWGCRAPHCPRPPRRVLPELPEPELISLEELTEDFAP